MRALKLGCGGLPSGRPRHGKEEGAPVLSPVGYDGSAPPYPMIGWGAGSKDFPSSRLQSFAAASPLYLPPRPRRAGAGLGLWRVRAGRSQLLVIGLGAHVWIPW